MSFTELTRYKGYELNEAQCRYAMANTSSNNEAARWLHISFSTWKKYALSYIDEETQLTLYELHKQRGLKNRLILPKAQKEKRKPKPWQFVPATMQDIFAGKYPNYPIKRLRERLVEENYLEDRCSKCGFQERRKFDYEIPLRLNYLDGNPKNFALENLSFLCLNCYFIHVGNVLGKNKSATIDVETGEIVPVRNKK
jgi:hypothetical protein